MLHPGQHQGEAPKCHRYGNRYYRTFNRHRILLRDFCQIWLDPERKYLI